jgi:hypothetical protein
MSFSPDALSARQPAAVRAEIEELQAYLAGLPGEWRASGSFLAYEDRLAALDRELALSQVVELASSLTELQSARNRLAPAQLSDTRDEMVALLSEAERHYAQSAAQYASRSRFLNYAALLASSATVVSVVGSIGVLVAPAAVAAAGAAAAIIIFRWSDRSREKERLADYLMALRNEIAHLGQSTFDLRPSADFTQASARVEVLISEVRSAQNGRRMGMSGT